MWAYLSLITTKFEFIKLACSFLCADQMHTMGATLHRDRFAFSLTIESIGAQHHHAAQSSSDAGQCCEHRPRSDPSHLEVLTIAKAVSTSTPNTDAALLDLVRQRFVGRSNNKVIPIDDVVLPAEREATLIGKGL
jgi:hypothetical protein